MMMMKNPVILVACTLLFSSLVIMASPTSYGPNSCCFDFVTAPLPKNKVVSYKSTDDLCPVDGVILKMLSGRELCANPSLGWVRNIIKNKTQLPSN